MDEPRDPQRQAIVTKLMDLINRVESLAHDAPSPGILNQFETEINRGVRKIGLELMQWGMSEHARHRPEPQRFKCSCTGPATRKGTWSKHVSTKMGKMKLTGKVYQCRHCGQGVAPGLEQLGLNGRSFTPSMQECMAALHAALPQRKAADMLHMLLDVPVHHSTLSHVSVTWGAHWNAELTQGQLPGRSRFANRIIYVGVDGMMVCGTDGAWHELKVGVVYDAAKERTSRYASFCNSQDFSAHWWHYTRWLGAHKAKQVRLTGDGSDWVWSVLDTNFPDAEIRFVDFYHVKARVWEYAKLRYGEASADGARWVRSRADALKAHGPSSLLRALCRQQPKGQEARESLRQLRGYVERHVELMDYPGLIARGIDIGDGPVESTCKQLGARLKGADKRWVLKRAQAVAVLRCLYLSGEWEALARPTMANRTSEQRSKLIPLIESYNRARQAA